MQDKINNNLYEANIKLVDENKYLKSDNEILVNKMNEIKELLQNDIITVEILDDIKKIIEG